MSEHYLNLSCVRAAPWLRVCSLCLGLGSALTCFSSDVLAFRESERASARARAREREKESEREIQRDAAFCFLATRLLFVFSQCSNML